MYWSELIAPILVTTALLILPGWLLGWVIGVGRGFRILLAPLLSTGAVAVAAVLLSLVGFDWGLVSFLVLMAVVLLVLGGMRLLLGRRGAGRTADPAWRLSWPSVAVALLSAAAGAVILATQLKTMLINPDAISQSYDNIFHLNAIRWISDSGDASSLTLGGMTTAEGTASFYPAAWHDLVSLVYALFPASIPAATNAVTFAVAAVAWPLSAVALAAALPLRSKAMIAATGVLSACFISYPSLLLKWGILYPNLLGFALLPAFLAVVLGVLRTLRFPASEEPGGQGAAPWEAAETGPLGDRPGLPREILLLGVLLTAGGAGLALAHPNGVTAAAVLSLPALLGALVCELRGPRRWGRAGLLTCAVILVPLIWWKLRPPAENSQWPPTLTDGQALGEFLLQSFKGHEALWILAALILAGAVRALLRPGLRWAVGAWALSGLLWVAVTSMEQGPLRSFISGPWYNDSFRLAALTVVPSIILAGLGLSWAADALTARGPRLLAGAMVPMILLAGWGLSNVQPLQNAHASVAEEFEVSSDSLLLTSDEFAVLDRVDDYVPEDGVIVVNPWEGSALAYALEDRRTTMYHTLAATPPEYAPILEDLDEPGGLAEACRPVENHNARWYLHFEDTLNIGAHIQEQFRGIDELVDSGLVEPLYTSGPVGLYKITGCSSTR